MQKCSFITVQSRVSLLSDEGYYNGELLPRHRIKVDGRFISWSGNPYDIVQSFSSTTIAVEGLGKEFLLVTETDPKNTTHFAIDLRSGSFTHCFVAFTRENLDHLKSVAAKIEKLRSQLANCEAIFHTYEDQPRVLVKSEGIYWMDGTPLSQRVYARFRGVGSPLYLMMSDTESVDVDCGTGYYAQDFTPKWTTNEGSFVVNKANVR